MGRLLVSILMLVGVSQLGFASMDAIDSECRIQAKETAINTYQTCVKDSRSQKIDEIRKEYQSKLNELKSYYDTELKKMSTSSPKTADEKPAVAEITLKKKSKSASSKSGGLPAKKGSSKSLPVRNMETDQAKPDITTSTEEGSDANEIVTVDESAI